jgi:elongation factor 3
VIEAMSSGTKPEVTKAAQEALTQMSMLCTHKETVKLREDLVAALIDPDKTEECMEKMISLTFVNAIGAPSLAIMVPVISRALVDGAGIVKAKAAKACASMCVISASNEVLRPFVQQLRPGLLKACDHSRPDIRDAANEAREAMEAGLANDRATSVNVAKSEQ